MKRLLALITTSILLLTSVIETWDYATSLPSPHTAYVPLAQATPILLPRFLDSFFPLLFPNGRKKLAMVRLVIAEGKVFRQDTKFSLRRLVPDNCLAGGKSAPEWLCWLRKNWFMMESRLWLENTSLYISMIRSRIFIQLLKNSPWQSPPEGREWGDEAKIHFEICLHLRDNNSGELRKNFLTRKISVPTGNTEIKTRSPYSGAPVLLANIPINMSNDITDTGTLQHPRCIRTPMTQWRLISWLENYVYIPITCLLSMGRMPFREFITKLFSNASSAC